jgi:hypothetical protein
MKPLPIQLYQSCYFVSRKFKYSPQNTVFYNFQYTYVNLVILSYNINFRFTVNNEGKCTSDT